MATVNNLRSGKATIAVVGLLLLLLVALVLAFNGDSSKTVTAEFPRAISVYKGSSVRILGVQVGQVDEVTPAGTKVVVKFHYDSKYKIPADAKAAVISPSIVGDRFIQLTPVYTKGAVLADDAHLGLDRTATPLELDEIFGSINDLTKALGPEGANKPDASGTGALTRLLDSTARNFGGQGVQFNQTLHNLSRLTKTLADNKDDLFGTVSEVEKFTQTLAANDTTVRQFNDSLAQGANLLADERADFAAVLQNLSVALTEVRGFVVENKDILSTNIQGLNQISKVLVKNRAALDESLKDAPVALNNLALAYNETAGTLDTRANIGEVANQLTSKPSVVLCGLLPDACGPLTSVLKVLGLGRPAPGASAPVRVVEPVDPTLAGLVVAR
ncbi:MCE family protein [Marmoricola sp. RAF53]|uniref:MCE family protein n=1 Tax=Marmoricola sp. RAF53 TaxID=3233059 RepID=UPI003F9925C2